MFIKLSLRNMEEYRVLSIILAKFKRRVHEQLGTRQIKQL